MGELEKRSHRLEERCPRNDCTYRNRFVVFSLAHTVTKVFVDFLNKSPDVILHGELFHELEVDVLKTSFLEPWTLYTRDESPSDFLAHIFAHSEKTVGFMSRPEHWKHSEDVFLGLANDKGVKNIVLTGDPFRSFAIFRKQIEDDELSPASTDYSAPAIQEFIDDMKRAERYYRDTLDPSYTLWISLDEFFSSFERCSSRIFKFLGVTSMPTQSAIMDLAKLITLEKNFHPLSFIREHTTNEEFEWIKFAFCSEDSDAKVARELSSFLNKGPQSQQSTRCRTYLEWALLVPIKSDRSLSSDSQYDWKGLKDFLDSLQKSLSDESRSRLTIYFGVDDDDYYLMKGLTPKLTEWGVTEEFHYVQVLLNEENGHICKIWKKLALEAYHGARDFFVLFGDDISFHSENWMDSIQGQFAEIAARTDLEYGVGCVAFNDLTFPGFPTFPVLHRSHIDRFPNLFSRRFVNQDADPYLFELYDRLGASVIDTSAKIRNLIGGHSSARYEKRRIRFKNAILSRGLEDLRRHLGNSSVLPSIDVVVPTYRMDLQTLDKILSLRVSRPCRVKFWIVVDNPNETHQLSNLCEKYDGKSANGNYHTQVLVHPKNLGASAARNSGIMRSLADWIVLFDDDVTPDEDILDQYLSATIRYPDAAGFAGVTEFPSAVSWWQRALKVSGVLTFYKIAALCETVQVPWSVTANLCIRGRTNDNIMFRRDYPKTGGGEDVDFCFRLKRIGKGIVGVPNAVVRHPWLGECALDAALHVMKWVTGDSMLVEIFPEHTFMVFPGWTEFILLSAIPALFVGVLLKVILSVLCLEMCFKCHAFVAQPSPDYVRNDDKTFGSVVFASFLLMGQEAIRTICHIKRRCPQGLCRRLDWFDGTDLSAVCLAKRQHAFKFIVYCLVLLYLGWRQYLC